LNETSDISLALTLLGECRKPQFLAVRFLSYFRNADTHHLSPI